jgi:hypothetical protein
MQKEIRENCYQCFVWKYFNGFVIWLEGFLHAQIQDRARNVNTYTWILTLHEPEPTQIINERNLK